MPYLICSACRLSSFSSRARGIPTPPRAAGQASADRCPRCNSLLSDLEPPQDTAGRWKLFDLRFKARLEGAEHEAR
jgi:hypothetical protein